MRSLVQFVKRAMVAANPLTLPADSNDMTVHDAIRICCGRYSSQGEIHGQRRTMDSGALPARG